MNELKGKKKKIDTCMRNAGLLRTIKPARARPGQLWMQQGKATVQLGLCSP